VAVRQRQDWPLVPSRRSSLSDKPTFQAQPAPGAIDGKRIAGGMGIYQQESVRLDAAACLSRRVRGYRKLPRSGLQGSQGRVHLYE
jgi:hypothetical protein